MIHVSITWYPRGGEQTFASMMPAAPAVGDSIHLDDDHLPIMEITHVLWVYNHKTGAWSVECSAR